MQPQPRNENPLLLAQGYGYIPKAVMTDRRLAASAKALYAYLCSFAGKDGSAWPAVDRICLDLGFGAAVFRNGLKSLAEAGYVRAERGRSGRNRFARYAYTLLDGSSPPAGKPPMEKPPAELPPAEEPPHTKNTVSNNTPVEDDDDPSAQTRAHARGPSGVPANALAEIERRRAAAVRPGRESATAEPRPAECPGGRRKAVARWFASAYGRRPNAAEVSSLEDLLARCSPEAVERMIDASARHAPAAPAPYVTRMAQRFRAGAAAMGLLTHPAAPLTADMIDRVEDRDRPFG